MGEGASGDGDADLQTEVVVNAEDEKAIEMFMNKNPPMRQGITKDLGLHQYHCFTETYLEP